MPISNFFKRVFKPDPDAVTVKIWNDNGGARGHVMGPMIPEGDQISMNLSRQDGSLTGKQALDLAVRMANKLGVRVVVILEKGDWDPEWGDLI
jgi:hypothetical protein